jgi:aminoglycoside N3'-acetyltransferase
VNAEASITLPNTAPAGPVFVHSDALVARNLVLRTTNRVELLHAHLDRIESIADGRDIWFPAFNYSFPRSGVFNVFSDISELGPISECFRVSRARWRTRVPMFSACGVGAPPQAASVVPAVVNPFGRDSVFAALYAANGSILWYGAPWAAATIIHFAEAYSNAPAYRYDKDFPGEIVEDDHRWTTILRSHVRPMNRAFNSAWPRLYEAAAAQGIVQDLPGTGGGCFWAPVGDLVRSWTALLAEDPLALLDSETRNWVAPKLERLGRRFELSDFEPSEEPSMTQPHGGVYAPGGTEFPDTTM